MWQVDLLCTRFERFLGVGAEEKAMILAFRTPSEKANDAAIQTAHDALEVDVSRRRRRRPLFLPRRELCIVQVFGSILQVALKFTKLLDSNVIR